MSSDNDLQSEAIDLANLYKQESFTDLGLGSIQRLLPVLPDGNVDTSRTAKFIGSASILTPHGAIPVQCEIDAVDLRDACEKFPEAIKAGVQDLLRRAQQMERERHNGIVIPKAGSLELP